jgi:hypothetical protein
VLGGLAGQVIDILSDGITALLPAPICSFALCDNPLKRSLIVCFKCSTNLLLKFSLVIITFNQFLTDKQRANENLLPIPSSILGPDKTWK